MNKKITLQEAMEVIFNVMKTGNEDGSGNEDGPNYFELNGVEDIDNDYIEEQMTYILNEYSYLIEEDEE